MKNRKKIRGEGIDIEEKIEEMVVEIGKIEEMRKGIMDIGKEVEKIGKGFFKILRKSSIIEEKKEERIEWSSKDESIIKSIEILEIILKKVSEMIESIVNGRERKVGMKKNSIEGKLRIIIEEEVKIGKKKRKEKKENEIKEKGEMIKRKVRKIE